MDMDNEIQQQQTSDAQGSNENPMDAIKQLREENAARRIENNELKALMSTVLDAVQKGQKPADKPEQIKSEKGQELYAQVSQSLDGMNSRLEAAEKLQTDFKALQEQLANERLEREKAQMNALKVQIGAKYGLPDALVARLQGGTAEEIENDAKQLAPIVGKRGGGILGNPGEATPPSQAKTIYERARGGNTNPFDPSIQGTTGGVGGKPE